MNTRNYDAGTSTVYVGWFRCCVGSYGPDSPKLYRDWRVFDIPRVMRLSEGQASAPPKARTASQLLMEEAQKLDAAKEQEFTKEKGRATP